MKRKFDHCYMVPNVVEALYMEILSLAVISFYSNAGRGQLHGTLRVLKRSFLGNFVIYRKRSSKFVGRYYIVPKVC